MRVLPRGLYARVALLVCAILATTVVSYGWVTSVQQGARLEAALREEAATVAETIAETSLHHLVVGDYAALEELVLEVAELGNVLAVEVVEPDGAGLVSVVHEGSRRPDKVVGRFRREPPQHARPLVEEEPGRIVLWHPILAGGILGWVRMTSDLAPVAQTRAAIWRSSLVLGALWVVGGSSLLLLLLRPTAADVRRLAAFARSLGERRGDRVAVGDAPAEIAELGAALNAASAELLAREQELLAERERLEVTLRSIGEAVIVTDTAGVTILMNHVAEALTGWPAAEALGRPVAEICSIAGEGGAPVPEHPAAAALRFVGAGPAGGGETAEPTVLLPRSGAPRNIVANGAPIVDRQGRILGTVTVVRDVTERAALERQLRQAQKMEAVGQLAGGIAHDFNNILTAIIGYGALMRMRAGGDATLQAHLAQVLEAAERAATLTQSLLAFSRKQVMTLRAQDLNAVVRGLEKILARVIREDITLRVALCARELPVFVDRGQIEQVLLNLVTNARDAMPHGGEIRIATEPSAPDADGGGWGAVSVVDTGLGMTREVREKIFEPFFTTKEVGKGTGLGLAVAYGIVTQHRGRITVESEPGTGTTFRILLPLARTGGRAPEPPPPPPEPGRGETILVVEDDGAVREVTRTILESSGYRVLAAVDGEEGLAVFRADPDAVDLVISDVIMPRAGGEELLAQLRAIRPALSALLVSGYTPDAAIRDRLGAAGVPLLVKPVTPESLLRAVRAALDRGGRRTSPAAARGAAAVAGTP